MLDFRLETFLSVCDTMNYRRSAELLHITQPAVTQHIQHLEKFYGHKLFRYEGRRLKKTAAAELLEQYARTMKINEADMLRQMDERQIHDLRIGVTKTIAQCVIGQYAEHFLRCPDNDLTLIDENTQNLLDLIDQCKLDFALIEGIFDRRKYGSIRFSTEPFVGICAPDHPFAHQEVTIAQLLDQTLLCRRRAPAPVPFWKTSCWTTTGASTISGDASASAPSRSFWTLSAKGWGVFRRRFRPDSRGCPPSPSGTARSAGSSTSCFCAAPAQRIRSGGSSATSPQRMAPIMDELHISTHILMFTLTKTQYVGFVPLGNSMFRSILGSRTETDGSSMSIGAIQKTTLFWQGCNLRCPVPLPTICSPLWTGSTTTGLAWRPFSEPAHNVKCSGRGAVQSPIPEHFSEL